MPQHNHSQFTITWRRLRCFATLIQVFCVILTLYMALCLSFLSFPHFSPSPVTSQPVFSFFSAVFQNFLAPGLSVAAPGSVLRMTMSIMLYEDLVASVMCEVISQSIVNSKCTNQKPEKTLFVKHHFDTS